MALMSRFAPDSRAASAGGAVWEPGVSPLSAAPGPPGAPAQAGKDAPPLLPGAVTPAWEAEAEGQRDVPEGVRAGPARSAGPGEREREAGRARPALPGAAAGAGPPR